MIYGETYYSVQVDNGTHVVRRHYWDEHPFDHQMDKEGNVYIDESAAKRQADFMNEKIYTVVIEEKSTYKGDHIIVIYLKQGKMKAQSAKILAERIDNYVNLTMHSPYEPK